MKTLGLLLGMLLACAGSLRAQVTVELSLDQEQFLPGEALNAIVRITNLSGQTLNLGSDEGWLKFVVESRDGFVVEKKGEAPVAEKIFLDSAKAAIKRVDIAPYFNLRKPGRYSVSVTATIKDWNQRVSSAPKTFDIIRAAPLFEKDFGVPPAPGAPAGPPEVRRFSLLQANYLQKLTLYAQVADAAGRTINVYPLGPMLNTPLETKLDRLSNLHVLYQIGAHSSCYTLIDPDGRMVKRQTYDFTVVPRMKFDEEGNVIVAGGTRRVKPDDWPPPQIANGATNRPESK